MNGSDEFIKHFYLHTLREKNIETCGMIIHYINTHCPFQPMEYHVAIISRHRIECLNSEFRQSSLPNITLNYMYIEQALNIRNLT